MKRIIASIALVTCAMTMTAQEFHQELQAFKKSYEYEKAQDLKNAIKMISDVYKPGSYEMNLRLGWLFYSNNDYDKSVTYYQRAIELRPYAVEARFGIIYPYTGQENWDAIKAQYEKILESDPNNTGANYFLGMYHYYRQNYETANRLFKKVAELYPFDYNAVLMYAWSSYYLGNTKEATLLFRKALMYDPESSSAAEGLEMID